MYSLMSNSSSLRSLSIHTLLLYNGPASAGICCAICWWGYRIFGIGCSSSFLCIRGSRIIRRSLAGSGCSLKASFCISFSISCAPLLTSARGGMRFILSIWCASFRFCCLSLPGATSAISITWITRCRCYTLISWEWVKTWRSTFHNEEYWHTPWRIGFLQG